MTLEGHHMSAFAAAPTGLELQLSECVLTAAAKDVLKSDIGLRRIKITLDRCDSDTGLLADVLDGTSIVKGYSLKNYNDDKDRDERELAACVHALKHNQGLVQFSFGGHVIRTDTLIAILHSLKTHPTLEHLNLYLSSVTRVSLSEGVDKLALMKAIADMLQVNRVIQEIELDLRCYEEAGEEKEAVRIHDEMIRPLLKANRITARLRGLVGAWDEGAAYGYSDTRASF
jgi:hypothetical protein